MNEDWLHKIHDRMNGYEIDEPENLWDAIESKHSGASSAPSTMKSPVMIWVKRSIAAAAIIAVIISAGVYLINIKQEVSECRLLTETTDDTVYSPENVMQQRTTDNTTPHQSPDKMIAQNTIPAHTSGRVSSDSFTYPEISAETVDQTITQNPACQNVVENRPAKTDVNRDISNCIDKEKLPQVTDNRPIAPIRPKRSASGNVSVSVYSSGSTGSALNYKSKGVSLMAVSPDKSDWGNKTLLGILAFNQGNDTEIDIKHRLPIRAGISFAYNLSERLGIETGLSYTNLVSDIKEGSESIYYTSTQKLHYIGIPFNLKYKILSWKRVDLYASAGALAEKCVSATIDKEFILDYRKKGPESENLPGKPVQWSVNAAAGLQCNLVSSMSIFVEPGVSYYFNDGTNIPTIYKEKPLNFNLNMGIRFTFGK